MGFEIDPKSVVLFAGVSVVIAILLGVAVGRNMRRDPAFPWLQAANLSYLVAVCAVLARPAISFETVSLLVIAGAFAGMSFAFAAMLVAEGRRPPLGGLAAVGLASVAAQAVFAGFVDSAAPLMITSSTVNSAVTLYMVVVVWRLMRPHGHRMALLLALPFGAFFAGYFVRLLSLLALPEPDTAFAITVLIIAILAWSSIILELGAITLRERQGRGALRIALDRAEAASAAKSRFLSGVSHELRTPLNGVIGLAELMRSEALGPLPQGYLSFAKGVHDNGARMLDLVSDLLDIAAVGVGTIRLEERRVDLDALLGEIEARMAPQAAARGVRLSVRRLAEAPEAARADASRLTKMLLHLLGNAVKYAPNGGFASLRLRGAEDGGAVFLISDDGAGMSEEEISIALELFGRVGGVDNAENGAGIGLTLAQEIARAHGAALEIDSEGGQGTVVTVALPGSRSLAALRPGVEGQLASAP